MEKGLLIVYTGNGKGKTTAALGLALRALGYGKRVCLLQFVKGKWKTGEIEALKRFKDLMDVHITGHGFILNGEDVEKEREAASAAWELARGKIASPDYGLVILDELTYLINFGILSLEDVLNTLQNRREDLHVVITGRQAPEAIKAAADLVTEMRNVKHPYENGMGAQKGVEF